MDPITLAPIRLTQLEYFRLLVKLQLRKSGWMYLLLLVMGGLLWIRYDGEPFHLFLICFSFGLPFVMAIRLYAWSRRKDNQRVYEERSFVLDEEKLVGTTPGGGRSEIPWSYVQRMVEVDGRYLLYISAGQMVILDKAAFPDGAAEQRFLAWVRNAVKK
jgi:hypothetical protein